MRKKFIAIILAVTLLAAVCVAAVACKEKTVTATFNLGVLLENEEAPAVSSKTVVVGKTLSKPASPRKYLIVSGKRTEPNVFDGWYRNAECTGDAVSFPLDLYEDTTFYAKWTPDLSVETDETGEFLEYGMINLDTLSHYDASGAAYPDTSAGDGFVFGVVGYKAGSETKIGNVTIPASRDGKNVLAVARNAFSEHNGMDSVAVAEGVTAIGQQAFANLRSLKEVKFPSTLTRVDAYTFEGSSGMSDVDWENVSITTIPTGMFRYCSGLANVIIPASVTKIGQSAFEGCGSLTAIKIPATVTEVLQYAFNDALDIVFSVAWNKGAMPVGWSSEWAAPAHEREAKLQDGWIVYGVQ